MKPIVRTISFNLKKPINQDKISSTLLIARGYNKPDVLSLFDQLQNNNWGLFNRGKRGRGCVAEFTPNENCPEVFEMTFEITHRGRKKKLIEPIINGND